MITPVVYNDLQNVIAGYYTGDLKVDTPQQVLDFITGGSPTPWQEYWGGNGGVPANPSLGDVTDAIPIVMSVYEGLAWNNGVYNSVLNVPNCTVAAYKAAVAAYSI